MSNFPASPDSPPSTRERAARNERSIHAFWSSSAGAITGAAVVVGLPVAALILAAFGVF